MRTVALVYLSVAVAFGCTGGAPVGSFRLSAQPEKGGPARALRSLNALPAGLKIRYEPMKNTGEDAEVALLLATDSGFQVLDPKPAGKPATWTVPDRTTALALVLGPKGVNAKKLRNLAKSKPELLGQLADYAQQNTQLEGLIEALATSERQGTSLEAALTGFSSRYNVAMPRLDPKASTDQQAAVLLRALMPTMSAYDPLNADRASVMAQSAGLATSIAAMVWGNPVGVAAGGAALAQNLKTILFPNTEFHSAFAQGAPDDNMTLCGKREAARARTRPAFLWAHRFPEYPVPESKLAETVHLPVGVNVAVPLTGVTAHHLNRADGWRLLRDGKEYPIKTSLAADTLTIDGGTADLTPGSYEIAASWDWQEFKLAGEVHFHELEDLSTAKIPPQSRDRLVEGAGPARIQLVGPDFQFVERAELGARELPVTLPAGRGRGEQRQMEVGIDTTHLKAGEHQLVLRQAGGRTHELALHILPPHPKIENAPVRINLGESAQKVWLRGSGLERIENLAVPGAELELGPVSGGTREVVVRLKPETGRGSKLAARMSVTDISVPLEIPGLLAVAGPRPKIRDARRSGPDDSGMQLREGEIAADQPVSVALSVEHASGPATVELVCAGGDQKIALRPGQRTGGAGVERASDGLLFLSVVPGSVVQPGCELEAALETSEGRSDAVQLGRVTRVPRLETFSLTDEQLGESVYAGLITGTGLELIEKAGWMPHEGLDVRSLPVPVGSDPRKQTLKIALPWPSPSPKAPLYVWLRGEPDGRRTSVRY